MFKRSLAIVLTAGAVVLFGGAVLAGAQSVSNKPAPAFVPEAVPEVTRLAPVSSTIVSVPASQPPATTATSVPSSPARATTSTPTSQPHATVTSVPTSVPASTTVVTIDDHGGDRPRTGSSGSGRSGGRDD